jgi:hypothetical protein
MIYLNFSDILLYSKTFQLWGWAPLTTISTKRVRVKWIFVQDSKDSKTETGQLSSWGLFLSQAAVRRYIAASKPCCAAKMGFQEIQVDVRTSDVMAGAGGGAGRVAHSK